jgi:hypothetical protein
MYRVISIVLAMVALAIVFFGLSLCDGAASCEQIRASRLDGLASHPVQVERIMVLAGLLAFVGGAIGFLRGPTTLPPWADRGRTDRARMDVSRAPMLVRGAAFLGALFALAGIVLPVLAFAAPVARGLGFPFAVTIVAAVLLAGYFGWHLRQS